MLVHQTAWILHDLKAPRVILKLDIARAFDAVAWPFLLEALTHLGFGRRWCDWICTLISTMSNRVLINGSPRPPIDHEQGLRQVDPLSPMLFVIIIDMLNTMLQHVIRSGALSRITR